MVFDYIPMITELVVEARLYTLYRGVLPVFSQSSYCRSCFTRYYPNYSVQEAQNTTSRQEYYTTAVPDFIHVTESSFVESKLCVYFEMQMAMSHASAEGIAKVYNLALGSSEIPNASHLSHELDSELVLNSFFYHAVLRDKSLQERNYRMVGTGQEMAVLRPVTQCDELYRTKKCLEGRTDGEFAQVGNIPEGV
ncbi:hypothetical protein B0H10DRAFT_1945765 [Mycena sp. CBHHK59/15]|nr:hypothetical protein B0H10DRAFT_1945765 [Mycena sp. CBHHK59/15]